MLFTIWDELEQLQYSKLYLHRGNIKMEIVTGTDLYIHKIETVFANLYKRSNNGDEYKTRQEYSAMAKNKNQMPVTAEIHYNDKNAIQNCPIKTIRIISPEKK
jgi:hypothetical protein